MAQPWRPRRPGRLAAAAIQSGIAAGGGRVYQSRNAWSNGPAWSPPAGALGGSPGARSLYHL
jgi:hypothetical protein